MCEFCRGYHAKPAEGYFSLSPGQPIITDPIERLWKGDTFKDDLTPASGYAVIVDGKMRHLGKVPLARARQIAMKSGDTATIAAAVGFSDLDVLVWRNVEIIDRTKGGLFVGDDGELMRKMSPFEQIEDMTDVYADKLKTEYSKWAKGQMDEYFSHLDVNWYDVDDVEAVFASAGDEAITDKKDVDRLSNAWGASALIYTTMAASQAREFTKSAFLPKIGSSISTGDRQAMKFLSDQPGFFVRDHLGRVDAGLTKAGKAIVNRGIRDGIGYQEIGKELREQLPGMWGKYGANYSNVVANAGVQRSRAFAEITSYVEAGIEFAELIAVLDQRTTDTCFLGETMVSTPTGQKRIDSIKIGDLVVTASGLERKVIGTQRRWANNLCEIIFSNGLKLFVTGNHSIVTEGGWKKSEELKENDRVAVLQATTPKKKAPSTIADTVGISQQEQGKEGRRPAEFYLKKTTDFITVKSTMRLGRYYEVFNLEVDEDHTYLAENIQVSNCRMLDGQIIRVDSIVDILNQTLEIENPEEIREVSPWISTKKNPSTGVPQLVTRNGVVLADIVRSGYGKIDDRGQFAARLMGDQLAVDASIGPPPYHAYCRTTMNPVVKTFQVPPKTWRVAIPTTPLNPKEANPITTPSFLRGLTAAAYVNSIGAADRGYMTGRNPTVSRHVSLGMPGDPEAGVWGEDGWIDSMDAREQVERRVSNSLSRLSNALNELYRAKGRRDLSYKSKGRLLRSIFKKRISELRTGSVTMQKVDFSSHDRVRGDMPQTEADKIRRFAIRFLSDRMQRVVARRKLPRIVEKLAPKTRPLGYWNKNENVFYLPQISAAKQRAVVLRVFAEYFDTFGHCGEAAVISRNGNLASDTISNVNGVLYLDVATSSFFDGLIVGQTEKLRVNASAGTVKGVSDVRSEWTKSAFECLADGFETNLGFLWDTAPVHVAFLLAYIEGQFV